MTDGSERLSFWRKIGFGLGDIYGGGSGVIIGFYYLYFLTDVIRINAALAGIVILISKVYDAITDPFEGVITDRTRSRMGRRRRYPLDPATHGRLNQLLAARRSGAAETAEMQSEALELAKKLVG